MTSHRGFADILQEKLGENMAPTTASPPAHGKKKPFPWWQYLPQASKNRFVPLTIPAAYPRPRPTLRETKRPVKPQHPLEPTYQLGDIGLEYSTDIVTLQNLGADLDPSQLSLSSLKRQYRRLAKRWHPDHHAHAQAAEPFQQLTQAYQNLQQALTALSTDR
jgi:hypothetical protein